MKKFRGYIFSRVFQKERVPQHVQNSIIREFCKKKNIEYLLSASEYTMKNSFLILNEIMQSLKNIDGIVAYSLFQMPEDETERNKIFSKLLKNKKIIYFANENLELKNKNDLIFLNYIWDIKQTLPFSFNEKIKNI
tara:strand:+ start:103 stop:510 length:408 start_codon:yes stop_codon:yes gene_type:complete